MEYLKSLEGLSDTDLVSEVARAVSADHQADARVIACLVVLETRRLYLGLGFSSLFSYCRDNLRFSEDVTFNRIEVARAARKFPIILDQLADGSLSLAVARTLAPHLTADNHKKLLSEARHKTKREAEAMIAKHKPLPPVASTIRKLPRRNEVAQPVADQGPTAAATLDFQTTGVAPAQPSRRPVIAPLSEEFFKVQVTFTRVAHDKLRQAQALMRHQLPDGDPAVVLERALDVLLADLLKKKAAIVARPRSTHKKGSCSRKIPAEVKRIVWTRDGGRCMFQGTEGRCEETGFLEYHHVVPYAKGGQTTAENLELRCRAHNAYEAQRDFGSWFVREVAEAAG